MSDTKTDARANTGAQLRARLHASGVRGAERERRAIIADLRTEADAYGGTIGAVLLAVATRIERGSK